MNERLNQGKKRQRDELLARRQTLTNEQVGAASECVCEVLLSIDWLKECHQIATYAALRNEISLDRFMATKQNQGARIFYPRYNADRQGYELAWVERPEEELIPGYLGIREPRPEALTLTVEDLIEGLVWFIPGIAFDQRGRRLGRGQGHYDRMLRGTTGRKIGVGYDWQIVSEVISGPEDMPMNFVVTDRQWIVCSELS